MADSYVSKKPDEVEDRQRSASSSSSSTVSSVINPLKNVYVEPKIKMSKVCIYCKIRDEYSFSGRFENCEKHGGKNVNDDLCFQCIIRSNGEKGRFALCSEHEKGASEYRVLRLRTMSKIIKIEDNDENSDTIKQIKRNKPIIRNLSSDDNYMIVTRKKARQPKFMQVKKSEKQDFRVITEMKKEIDSDHDYAMPSTSSGRQHSDRHQTADDSNRNSLSQEYTPGTSGGVNEPNPDYNPEEGLKVPDAGFAVEVLDRDLINVNLDRVWNGYHAALTYLFDKFNVEVNNEQRSDLIDMITTLIKINVNIHKYGAEFLVEYRNAQKADHQEMMKKLFESMYGNMQKAMSNYVVQGINGDTFITKVGNNLLEYMRQKNAEADMTEQPPLKRLKPNENELYELPNGTGTRSFTKEQIEKMIRLLDESVRPPPPPTPVASTSAGPSQEAIASIPLPTGMYRGRGRSRGRPRGFGNYGRGGHSMSPDFSAN